MNIIEHARQVPRGLIGAVRAEANPAEILAEIRNAVDVRLGRLQNDVEAIGADVDRLNTRMAGNIAAGAGEAPRGHGIKLLGEFARLPSSAKTGLAEFYQTRLESGQLQMPRNELQVGSNPDGGWTVLPDVEKSIRQIAQDVSPMRQISSNVQIATDAFEFIADPSLTDSGWVGERDTRSETATGQVFRHRIPVMEMYAEPKVTANLLSDSFVDIGAYLVGKIGTSFSIREGGAFVSGSGVMQPRGFLSYPNSSDDDFNADGTLDRDWMSLQYVATGSATPTDTQLADAIVKTVATLRNPYRANAQFLLSRDIYAKVRTLKDSQNRYLFSTDGRLGEAAPETLCGFPIAPLDPNMPAEGANATPIAFGDFRAGYCVVDRIGISLLRDPYTQKGFVLFYATKRVGGGLQDSMAIKLVKYATS